VCVCVCVCVRACVRACVCVKAERERATLLSKSEGMLRRLYEALSY
jgi:hypothetical protein